MSKIRKSLSKRILSLVMTFSMLSAMLVNLGAASAEETEDTNLLLTESRSEAVTGKLCKIPFEFSWDKEYPSEYQYQRISETDIDIVNGNYAANVISSNSNAFNATKLYDGNWSNLEEDNKFQHLRVGNKVKENTRWAFLYDLGSVNSLSMINVNAMTADNWRDGTGDGDYIYNYSVYGSLTKSDLLDSVNLMGRGGDAWQNDSALTKPSVSPSLAKEYKVTLDSTKNVRYVLIVFERLGSEKMLASKNGAYAYGDSGWQGRSYIEGNLEFAGGSVCLNEIQIFGHEVDGVELPDEPVIENAALGKIATSYGITHGDFSWSHSYPSDYSYSSMSKNNYKYNYETLLSKYTDGDTSTQQGISDSGALVESGKRHALLYDLGGYYQLSEISVWQKQAANTYGKYYVHNYSVYAANAVSNNILNNCIARGGTAWDQATETVRAADSINTNTDELYTTVSSERAYRYVLIVFDRLGSDPGNANLPDDQREEGAYPGYDYYTESVDAGLDNYNKGALQIAEVQIKGVNVTQEGDIMVDDVLDSQDLSRFRKVLLGTVTDYSSKAADLNTDNSVNIIDLIKLKKLLTAIENADSDYSKYVDYAGYDRDATTNTELQNTYTKLTQDKKLNVVYMGGSVTYGYGADPLTSSWKNKSFEWLQSQFPQADITMIDPSTGESGTYLGTYLLDDGVIAKNPDLVFMEYAINDNYVYLSNPDKFGIDTIKSQCETIIREIRTELPECDIVMVLTIDQGTKNYEWYYPTAEAHAEIAKAYDVPIVYVGRALADHIRDTGGAWNDYVNDIVHPNNKGYAIYWSVLKDYLKTTLIKAELTAEIKEHTLPELQSDHLIDGDRQNIFPTQELADAIEGWSYDPYRSLNTNVSTAGSFKANINEDMKPFTFTFTGTEIALYTNLKSPNMDTKVEFTYTVDDGEEQTGYFYPHNPTMIASGLESGVHTITVIPNVESATSQGYNIMYVSGIFCRDASQQTTRTAE